MLVKVKYNFPIFSTLCVFLITFRFTTFFTLLQVIRILILILNVTTRFFSIEILYCCLFRYQLYKLQERDFPIVQINLIRKRFLVFRNCWKINRKTNFHNFYKTLLNILQIQLTKRISVSL